MPSQTPDPPAPAVFAACSNAERTRPARTYAAPLTATLLFTMALPAALLGACSPRATAIADTYCRDTFYWLTAAGDTAETRRQADRHNSRRLCRCDGDCE